MKLFIAGHGGMVGSALVRAASKESRFDLATADRGTVDLRCQSETHAWRERPEVVVVAAAKVGGIHANTTYPAEFCYENLMIAANVIEGSRRAGVGRLLYLGSSCIYPREAPQPMPEDCLLSSALEPTNEAYAIAKIAGLKLCRSYREQYGLTYHSAMPTNLYGPGDNYHPENSHVIPALIRRLHEARTRGDESVTILARACLMLLEVDDPPDWINVGTGEDVTILEIAERIARTVGFAGEIRTDPSKPDGMRRKLLDVTHIRRMGWSPQVGLDEGLALAYRDFLAGLEAGTVRSH